MNAALSDFSGEPLASFYLFILRALCANPFLVFGTNENRDMAPSRKEDALTPRSRFGVIAG